MPENTLFAYRTEEGGATLDIQTHSFWHGSHKVTIDRFATGGSAFAEKGYGWTNLTQVSSLWNESALFFYFKCWYGRKPKSRPEKDTSQAGFPEGEKATLQLRPEACEGYFVISVDSRGLQSARYEAQPPVEIDETWDSGAETRVLVSETEQIWRAFLKVPYAPMIHAGNLSRSPEVGDAWRINLYRTAGTGEDFEFLSWQPSHFVAPDFLALGHLIFLEVS